MVHGPPVSAREAQLKKATSGEGIISDVDTSGLGGAAAGKVVADSIVANADLAR